jgi:4-alpha-glucanotransferase
MNSEAIDPLSGNPPTHRRRAGILVPLFSFPSAQSWGIGEIPDIAPMAHWLRAAGHRVLQLLPINEMPPGESSPYSALSAMAIDPQFIALSQLADFAEIGGEAALGAPFRERLDAVRGATSIHYAEIRDLKQTALRRAFAHFKTREWATGTRRAAALRAFIGDQGWWLRDYALFRAIHAAHGEQPWMEWPAPLRQRDPAALASAADAFADDVLYRQYLQWIAGDQWADARAAAVDVALFGDLPFMVGGDSADVWVHQDEFRLDASIGVPPDAFSATGQDWGLPPYRWDVIEAGDFRWLRDRARRNADLFDGYRVDHLVGFYRTYFRPHDGGAAQFTPATEPEQVALGERVLQVLRAAGAEIIAEDLGTVPDFVRESLTRLSIPGYKVFRWEREWQAPDKPFRDPRDYPPTAVATSGTHDTEPMVVWWDTAPAEERAAVLNIPSIGEQLSDEQRAAAIATPELSHDVTEAMLAALYGSGADLLLLPIQDVFGWRDRINQPATVGDANWTWRLPWPADRLSGEPIALAVATQLAEWCRRFRR